MTDYGYLWMFVCGLGCGYILDRFRLWLEAWAERQEAALPDEGVRLNDGASHHTDNRDGSTWIYD